VEDWGSGCQRTSCLWSFKLSEMEPQLEMSTEEEEDSEMVESDTDETI